MPQFGQTYFHPAALTLTLLMSAWFVIARRSHGVLAVLLVACLIPEAQRIVIAGQDFTMIRIMLAVGWLKLALSADRPAFRFHRVDLLLVAWHVADALIYTVREATTAALFNRLGHLFEGVGTYLLFRAVLVTSSDVLRAIRAFGVIVVPIAVLMAVEHLTGRNLFSALGSVPEISVVRDGRLRAQGAFSHPIMAGTFGAVVAPMATSLALFRRRGRWLATAALGASILVGLLSASSGPLVALIVGLGCWLLWPLRAELRWVRWAMVVLLVALHLIREQPVWQLIGRLSSFTGGTGYHRFRLIDAFINNFSQWWLMGTSSTLRWFSLNSEDLTNQYVVEGVRGGLLTLALFIATLTSAFAALGRARRRAMLPSLTRPQGRALAWVAWGLGAMLTTHCVSFVSAAYFGQMLSIFYLQLAMVTSFCVAIDNARHSARSADDEPSPPAAAPVRVNR